MERNGGRLPGEHLTRAQQALREAAKTMRERDDAPPAMERPSADVGDDQAPPDVSIPPDVAPSTAGPMAEQAGPASACPLLEIDEVFVGRPEFGAEFAYRDASGQVLADVKVLHTPEHSKLDAALAGESTRHVDERWVIVHDGEQLFFVEQYRATTKPSYGVFSPGGDPLGTYVSDGGVLHRDVIVREASSAPVATINVRHHRHVITHANGVEIGYCWRTFSAVGNDEEDEEWGLRIEGQADLLDRRALMAAPLVCHLLAFPKRHFDRGGEIGILLVETVPPVGLAVVGIERTIDGLYWLRRRLD